MNGVKPFINENKRWMIGLLVSIILASVLFYFVISIEDDHTDLTVDEVFFNSIEMEGMDSDLKITVLLTNEGKDDIDDVMVRAFVVERDSNLARDEDIAEMGSIPGRTTEEGELFISVPNNDTYRIEILVFEDSKLSLRGSGTIDLVGIGVASEYEESGDDDSDPPSASGLDWDEDESGTAMGVLCFVLLFAIIVIVIVIVVLKIEFKKKNKPVSKEEQSKAIPLNTIDGRRKEDDVERSDPGNHQRD